MNKKVATILLTSGILALIGGSYSVGHLDRNTQNPVASYGAIKGQVLSPEGTPVSGAEVYAERSDFTVGKLPVAKSNEQGRFLIKGLLPGLYNIYVSKEEEDYPDTGSAFHSFGYVDSPQITVYEQEVTPEVPVRMAPKAARLVGRFVDATTGQPIENAQIILGRVDNPDYTYATGPNQLDSKGAFKILVPSVPFTIKVSALGYKDWYYRNTHSKPQDYALQLAPNTTEELIISLQPIK